MTLDDIFTVIGALGGVAVIAGGVAMVVSNIVTARLTQAHKAKLDEQLETHKDGLIREADAHRLRLKRQELMFEREYAAAAQFFRLFRSFVPDPWAPLLDWSDVQPRIAGSFFDSEKKLGLFLDEHSASLSEQARTLISSAKVEANEGGFEVAQETEHGDYGPNEIPSPAVRKHVDKFYALLNDAEKQLRRDLREGSFNQG